MKTTSLKIILCGLAVLAAGGVFYINAAQPALFDARAGTAEKSDKADGSEPVRASLSSDEVADKANELDEEALAALLKDPRVQDYYARQQDKQALESYFSTGNSALSDSEAWSLIETIEGDGRVMAYEGLALKLAWLERNSASEAEFQDAARELVAEYRAKAEQSVREYDPYEDVPGFAEYKEAERRILQEVQAMESFPDGMTQQEYLRMRLQQAREAAYGS